MDVDNGEALSPDDIAEIHRQADEDMRAKMKMKVNTRTRTGEIEDYLEVRRPFGKNAHGGTKLEDIKAARCCCFTVTIACHGHACIQHGGPS